MSGWSRSNFLRVLSQDTKQWAIKHRITPFSYPCGKCGETLTTTIPFACGEFRGLVAPDCKCGNDRPPYGIVRDSRYGDLFK